jgi:protein phosphatase
MARQVGDVRRAYAEDRPIAHATNVWDAAPPPYDIIGDVHGCIEELRELLDLLGYRAVGTSVQPDAVHHPYGRTLIFVGDLNDRGPGSMAVWRLALASIAAGNARVLPGNHDSKFARYLMGRNVQFTPRDGLATTVREFLELPEEERVQLGAAIGRLLAESPPYRVFDGGRLVVAHAGLEEAMIGKVNRKISIFARYGEPTGEFTADGLPIRRDWAATYRGKPLIVYGHTPVSVAQFRNNTINIDTGCVFGGALTALSYPELKLVSVPARRVYAEPAMVVRTSPPDPLS